MLLTSVIHPQSCLNYVKRLISSQSSEILYEKTKGKVVLTLNRPNQMNAMNATFQRQLLAAYKNIHSDPNVNLVIVKANGKVFCAGGDVKDLYDALETEDKSVKFTKSIKVLHEAWARMSNLNIPVVSFVDGMVLGGGCGLAFIPKYTVLTDNVKIVAMPEVSIGHWPDAASCKYFGHLPNRIGILMAVTGYRFSAADLISFGFERHFVERTKLDKLETELMALDNTDDASVEKVLNRFSSKPHPTHDLDVKRINDVFSSSTVEEIISNLKADGSEWSQKVADKMIDTFSPFSMKLGLSLYLKSQSRYFDNYQAIKQDYALFTNVYADESRRNDFRQGIKCAVFEKSKPQWNPSKLEQLDTNYVNSFLNPEYDL